MAAPLINEWSADDVRLGDVDRAIGQLRAATTTRGSQPSMRTSVMTHMAWVPQGWEEAARGALSGMAERHPSRTILLFPDPNAGTDGIDAGVAVETFAVPGVDREICTEVVELHLRGARAKAPASIVEPLLISDLPVFLRWRGEPPWGAQELEQLVGVTDRVIVDSTEWDDLPHAYRNLSALFDRAAVSDIAWSRTARWRTLLADLWPDVADVGTVRIKGTQAQALLIVGWLRSRLGRPDIELEHVEAKTLEGIDLDGNAAPFPSGDPPAPSDVLSDELDKFTRDPIYEAAVLATLQ